MQEVPVAFIDEVASIVKVPIEQFNALAQRGTCVYDISGRCGVYAKTDIQPLLNQGIAKSDLALSAFPCDRKADHRRSGPGTGY